MGSMKEERAAVLNAARSNALRYHGRNPTYTPEYIEGLSTTKLLALVHPSDRADIKRGLWEN